MILPEKHLSLSESYFGFGAFLLNNIKMNKTVDALWEFYKDSYTKGKYSVKFSFDQFLLALDYLYIIGAIKENDEGGGIL